MHMVKFAHNREITSDKESIKLFLY